MIARLVRKFKERQALWAWQSSPLGQVLTAHTREYFTQYPRLADWSQESKNKVVEGFVQALINVTQAENPFLAMRESLASYVVALSNYQALCLTEEEKASQFYADCPYISGELHRHMDDVVEHIDELRELKWKYPDTTAEELVSYCNTRCVLHLYYVNGFNYVRTQFDDYDQAKDWLRPFITSMLIVREAEIREKIGLPELLEPLEAVKHSTFMNMVMNGHRNPYYEWEKTWKSA